MNNKNPHNVYTDMILNLFSKYPDKNNIYNDYDVNDNVVNHVTFPINVMNNETITVNDIEYTFSVRSYGDKGEMQYAILQHRPNSKRATPCLHCHIDDDACIIDNLTRHDACSFPTADKHLAKKMIQLLKKIIKREEPDVKYIKLTDLATIKCNNKEIHLSDMYMLTHGNTFYGSMNFKYDSNINKNDTYKNAFNALNKIGHKLKDEKFSMERLQKAMNRYQSNHLNQLNKSNNINKENDAIQNDAYLHRKGLTFTTAMKYLYNNYCSIMALIAPTLLAEYGLKSSYGSYYILDI